MFTKQAMEERKQIYVLLQQSRKLQNELIEGRTPHIDLDIGDLAGVARLAEATLRSRWPPGRLEEAMHSAESVPPNPFFMSRG
jgi:hypothetical protein